MQPSTAPAAAGSPIMPIAERLASEAPLAVGAALYRAHDALRPVVALLELEAGDPLVRDLHRRARALQRDVAAAIVEVAATATDLSAARSRDCAMCLVSVEGCEASASACGGRCCDACTHG